MSREVGIDLINAGVDFPVYNAASLSLKNRLLSSVTGGAIDREHDGLVVVRGLQDINLKISAGERVGLVGHNGAGKTTMLRVLSGIYQPTQGEARIRGECVSLIDISLGIDPEATGRENIRLRSAMLGFTPDQTRKCMDEIIEFSGLGNFIEMPFRTYSSGMQLRLAFAVSTTVNPQILIMDEWLSTGDENFRERAEQRMRRVVDTTDILILASHSRHLLQTNCDRIIWLEHGRVRRDGEASKVLDEYLGPEIAFKPAPEPVDLEERRETIRLRHAAKAEVDQPRAILFSESELPGNDVAKLLGCRLLRSDGSVLTSVLSSEDFELELTYRVIKPDHLLWTGCIVNDESGSALFWTGDMAPGCITQTREPGVWSSRLQIPGRLLAPGVVQFTVAVGDVKVLGHNHAHAVNILPMQINDDLSDAAVRGPYRGPIPGVFRPKLEWQTERISGTEGAGDS
jgi:lipopolysaccharide transport system ATP-binding protein